MQISVLDPIQQTIIFTAFLLAAIFFTSKKNSNGYQIQHSHTNELKGLAILMIIFSHAGYFLSTDHRFLYPLSTAGGVGVNVFLFLSGFGLTMSSLKSNYSILGFYKKRLPKIFIPMWIVVSIFLILSFFVLGKNYPSDTLIQSFLGFFPKADIYTSLNSPLWYFSLILFYYLIFPLVFWKKIPLLSVFLTVLVGVFFTNLALPVDKDVLKLYKLHDLAFPLGMGFAIFLKDATKMRLVRYLFRPLSLVQQKVKILKAFLTLFLIAISGFTIINSGVGEGMVKEQFISLVTVLLLATASLLKKFQSKFLILLGIYSYEIYLIQWPLVLHYDLFYQYFPASIATILYLSFYLALGFCLKKLTQSLFLKKL